MGGEPNFDGQANSLWLYHNDIGAMIYRAIHELESNLAVQPSPIPEKPDRFPRSRSVIPELPRSASASRVGPAVAEAHEILDFGESFIALEELFAYAPDNSSNVYPITVFAAPSDEAFVVYPIVDRSIGHPAARFRRQEMDDVVLDQGEAHVEIVPICPADIRVEDELAADHETGRGGAAADFGDLSRRRRRLAKISTPRALSMKSTAPVSNARFSWAVKP